MKLNTYYRTYGDLKAVVNLDATKLEPLPAPIDKLILPYEGYVLDGAWKKAWWDFDGKSKIAEEGGARNVKEYDLIGVDFEAYEFLEWRDEAEEPESAAPVDDFFEDIKARSSIKEVPDDFINQRETEDTKLLKAALELKKQGVEVKGDKIYYSARHEFDRRIFSIEEEIKHLKDARDAHWVYIVALLKGDEDKGSAINYLKENMDEHSEQIKKIKEEIKQMNERDDYLDRALRDTIEGVNEKFYELQKIIK